MESLKPLGGGDPREMGPYRLVARLGAGGMGRVYLGRSRGGRAVAVKVVRPELAEDHEFRQRFAREVAAARRVNGVFTAGVVDADPDADPPWLATAYVPGMSLDVAVARSGAWPEGPVTSLAAGLAEALEAIHGAGLVHRDLKPSNVLLAPDGPRVIDFGISVASELSAITRTGAVIGTPGFMSPEQLTGGHVGPASDVFALGAVLAFAASGTGPFGTGSAQGLMFRIVYAEPELDAVAPGLRPLVARCLAKEPGERPPVGELLSELTDAAGASQTTLLFTSASWLPESVARTVREYAQTVAEEAGAGAGGAVPASGSGSGSASGSGSGSGSGSQQADAETRTALPGGRTSSPPPVPPTPSVPPTPPPSVPPAPPPAPPPASAPSVSPAAEPPHGHGSGTGTVGPGSGGLGTSPSPHPTRRRLALASAAAVVLIGVFAWQAEAIFGSGNSPDDSAGASPYSSATEYSATPSQTSSYAPSPTESATEESVPDSGASETSLAETSSSEPEPEPSQDNGVEAVTGRWLGSYVCNQGITGLSLTIEDQGDGDVSAVFSFFPAPSNPLVPRGSFAMTGTYLDGELSLAGDYWIEQPPDFLMVGLAARYDPGTPEHLDGAVQGPGCSSFSVSRS
ncbi:serine/threonine-protein kinase [Streptomyces sp. NPDC057445]|uniref:serine/threonine-protein kinase n=1 Tax=Streptomyces sp. NPDC057445 TaxID=3346136 RepID=UPI0036B7FE6E